MAGVRLPCDGGVLVSRLVGIRVDFDEIGERASIPDQRGDVELVDVPPDESDLVTPLLGRQLDQSIHTGTRVRRVIIPLYGAPRAAGVRHVADAVGGVQIRAR